MTSSYFNKASYSSCHMEIMDGVDDGVFLFEIPENLEYEVSRLERHLKRFPLGYVR